MLKYCQGLVSPHSNKEGSRDALTILSTVLRFSFHLRVIRLLSGEVGGTFDRLTFTREKQSIPFALKSDMNAKVGNEEEYKEVTGGKSRHTTSNDNGRRVVGFSFECNMKIVSTIFYHKNIRKETWIVSIRVTRNQIDHVLIERKQAKNVMDRPPKKKDMKETKKRYEVAKLKDRANKLITKPHKVEIEKEWMQIEAVMEEAAEKVLEKSKRKQTRKWFDDECKQVLEKRNRARLRSLEEGSEINNMQYNRKRKAAK
ncbi:hypothetical protein QE152_g31501 [Popillia japonica]|uniref:Uncharacterized protein n=1 Tax=Popillia japonica TaxID=7064 RepID=A0AAW1J0X1_POPJA